MLVAVLLFSVATLVDRSWLGLLTFLSFCACGVHVGLLPWVLTGSRGCLSLIRLWLGCPRLVTLMFLFMGAWLMLWRFVFRIGARTYGGSEWFVVIR